MSARTDVAAALKAGLPTNWRVIGHEDSPTLDRKTVMVWTTSVVPGPTLGLRTSTLDVWVFTPKQSNGWDDVEAALDQVLDVLSDADNLAWTNAVYQVWADTYPAYNITVTLITDRN